MKAGLWKAANPKAHRRRRPGQGGADPASGRHGRHQPRGRRAAKALSRRNHGDDGPAPGADPAHLPSHGLTKARVLGRNRRKSGILRDFVCCSRAGGCVVSAPPEAALAQSVEHRIRNAGVACSSHAGGTTTLLFSWIGWCSHGSIARIKPRQARLREATIPDLWRRLLEHHPALMLPTS
jgi:hypothetical protein